MTRGLVISRPIMVTHYLHGETYADGAPKKVTVSVASELDAQQLRYHLLFWDMLAYPHTGAMEMPSAEEDFLLKEGVLVRATPSIPYDRALRSVNVIKGILSVFDDLDRKEPGRWSLAEPGIANSLELFMDSEPDRAALVQLVNCIPVPNRDVPLQDVLNFKRQRADELMALRHHLERIYQDIVGATDRDLASLTETEALSKAVADALKVVRESKMKTMLGSLSGTLTVKDAFKFKEALAAFATSYTHGLGAAQAIVDGAIAGFGSAALQISAATGKKDATATGTPFKYATLIHTELFPGS
jgi:hypothetical protein